MDNMMEQWQNSAIDYDVYDMNSKEKITGFGIGVGVGFVALQIFFGILIFSIVGCIVCGIAGIKVYRKYLCGNRKRTLVLQFRDMLESLSTSVGTGKNIPEAFYDCLIEMRNQFGDDSYIVQEVARIVAGHSNNINIENMVADFAIRSHNEDIVAFSDVFTVAIRKGGNMKDIISDTKDIISDKITMQMEISSVISGKKNELNIMILMPFIVVFQVNGMTESSGDITSEIIVFVIKLVALGMFVGAYVLGQKMMKIEV